MRHGHWGRTHHICPPSKLSFVPSDMFYLLSASVNDTLEKSPVKIVPLLPGVQLRSAMSRLLSPTSRTFLQPLSSKSLSRTEDKKYGVRTLDGLKSLTRICPDNIYVESHEQGHLALSNLSHLLRNHFLPASKTAVYG